MKEISFKKEEIGKRVRLLREKFHLTESSFVSKIIVDGGKCSVSMLNRIENGKQLPTSEFLCSIKETFGVNIDELLFGKKITEVALLSELRNKGKSRNTVYQEFIRACYALCDNFKFDDENITCMRETREKNSIPIDSVAKACRVSVKSIYRIEQGNTMISTKHLITYHNLFGLSADYIIANSFMDLPYELDSMLNGYSYYTQIELIKGFLRLAKEFSLL